MAMSLAPTGISKLDDDLLTQDTVFAHTLFSPPNQFFDIKPTKLVL